MIVALVIAGIVLLTALRWVGRRNWGRKKVFVKLSWPAKEIMGVYNSIPEAHRPMADLRDALEAMDQSYGGVNKINDSYNDLYDHGMTRYFWNPRDHRTTPLGHSQYVGLYNSLKSVKAAADAQAHEFMMAGISHRLDRVQDIINAARQEKELIEQTTALVMGKEVL